MDTKTFEIVDRATFIPVIGVRLVPGPGNHADEYLIRRAGFLTKTWTNVMLTKLVSGEGNYDPPQWKDRTMMTAHKYITDNWDSLRSGAVIDVEYILGESRTHKTSERAGG